MDESDLVVGGLYFMVTYQDPKMTRPIILTFEFEGTKIHDHQDAETPTYYFDFQPPFHSVPESDDPTMHFFSKRDVESIVDIAGLVRELEGCRDRARGTV